MNWNKNKGKNQKRNIQAGKHKEKKPNYKLEIY